MATRIPITFKYIIINIIKIIDYHDSSYGNKKLFFELIIFVYYHVSS